MVLGPDGFSCRNFDIDVTPLYCEGVDRSVDLVIVHIQFSNDWTLAVFVCWMPYIYDISLFAVIYTPTWASFRLQGNVVRIWELASGIGKLSHSSALRL